MSSAEASARSLTKAGAVAGETIGLVNVRSPDFIVGCLASWLIDCSFTVMDPGWPPARVRQILDTCNCKIVYEDGIAGKRSAESGPARLSFPGNSDDRQAYVLFTSGSSGIPKGASIGHSALANTISFVSAWLHERCTSPPRGIVLAPLYYDVALLEIFATLAAGGTLYVADDSERLDPDVVSDWAAQEEGSWIVATPSWLQLLAGAGRSLQSVLVVSAGEVLPARLARSLLSAGAELWNGYGPTETAIFATMHRVRPDDRDPVPIGRPLANMEIVIVDHQLEPLSAGERGEILICGPGVGFGYVDDPGRTRESFLEFEGMRAYRTGDFGSQSKTSEIVCYGRSDRQIKFHGHRIELGDIESNARSCSSVVDAVALLMNRGTSPVIALVVTGSASADEVRNYLAVRLPPHMHPRLISRIEALPMNRRGKLDWDRLFELFDG